MNDLGMVRVPLLAPSNSPSTALQDHVGAAESEDSRDDAHVNRSTGHAEPSIPTAARGLRPSRYDSDRAIAKMCARIAEDWSQGTRLVAHSAHAVVITSAFLTRPGPFIRDVSPGFVRLTGYRGTELLGRSPRMLQGPLTDPRELERMKCNLRDHGSYEGEAFNYRKSGEVYLISWAISAIYDASGSVEGWLSLQRDVTVEIRSGADRTSA